MAPNLLLLTYSPELTGLPADTMKPSWLHRIYNFIVRSQTRRAEHEVARYLPRALQAARP